MLLKLIKNSETILCRNPTKIISTTRNRYFSVKKPVLYAPPDPGMLQKNGACIAGKTEGDTKYLLRKWTETSAQKRLFCIEIPTFGFFKTDL